MSKTTTFEDLIVWQKAHIEVMKIYRLTNTNELSKDFALRDQMRRAAISVTSNIAEGHERKSRKEFIYFLNVAKASCAELRSQLLIAKDLKYISESDRLESNNNLLEIKKMIFGLIKHLELKPQTNFKL